MFLTANENEDNGKGKKTRSVRETYFPDYRETKEVLPSNPEEGIETFFFGLKSWKENFPNLN